MSTSLGHLPEGRWTFDASVTECFEDMLARSIPQYTLMRQLVFALGCHFLHAGDTLLDLGCSTGAGLVPFVQHYGAACTYHGIEVSEPMLAAAHARFAQGRVSDAYGLTTTPQVTIEALDLRTHYPALQPALTLAVLTLMFIPLEYRQQCMQRMYAQTVPGGAVLVVEKILGASATLDTLWVEEYYASKRAQGYTSEEIMRKRLALEGVLVPMTGRWNEDLLFQAGFRQVECFWRVLNFAGWLAIKEG